MTIQQKAHIGTIFLWLYKTEFFSFQNNPETQDPSYKKFHRTDLVICSLSKETKPHLIAE